jgi:hypothetical protein
LSQLGVYQNNTNINVCANANELAGNTFVGDTSGSSVQFAKCSERYSSDCTGGDPDLSKDYYISVAFNTTTLDYGESKNYFKQRNNIFVYKSNNTMFYVYYLKQGVFFDDQALVFPDVKNYTYTLFSYLFNLQAPWDVPPLNTFTNFNFVSSEISITKRTYKKFPETLANVMAMLSFVNIVMKTVYTMIVEYLFMKYFLKKMLSKIDVGELVEKINKELIKCNIEAESIEDLEHTIKGIYHIVNLKNYLLSLLPFCCKKRKESIICSIVYSEFMEFLSMENLMNYNNQELLSEIVE